MMRSSTGGEREITAAELEPFSGLVFSTVRMFAQRVRREEDDLAQELWIVVWRALRAHDSKRSKLSVERYVFGCITNKIRDFKRDAAREHDRRDRHGVGFLHIEDMRLATGTHAAIDSPAENRQELFDGLFNFVTRDEVYGHIDGDRFEMPSTVTGTEAEVLVLLVMEMSKPEIMLRLKLTRCGIDNCVASLREKFADWKPTSDSSPRESTADAVRAEAELVGSRAA